MMNEHQWGIVSSRYLSISIMLAWFMVSFMFVEVRFDGLTAGTKRLINSTQVELSHVEASRVKLL
jgi:hypothetical protein